MNGIRNRYKPNSLDDQQINQKLSQKLMLKTYSKNGNQQLVLQDNKMQKSTNNKDYYNEFNMPVEYSDEKLQVKQISKQLICISPASKLKEQLDQGRKHNTQVSIFTDFKNQEGNGGIKKIEALHKQQQNQTLKLNPIFQIETKQPQTSNVYSKTEQTYDLISLNEEKQQITLPDDDNIVINQSKTKRGNFSQNLLNGPVLTEGSDFSIFGSTQTIPKFQLKSNLTTQDTQTLSKSKSDQRLNSILNQSSMKFDQSKSIIGILNSSQMNSSNVNNKSVDINSEAIKRQNLLHKSNFLRNSSYNLKSQSDLIQSSKPSSMLQKIQNLQTTSSFTGKQRKVFSDISHLEQHFTNIMDYPKCKQKIYDSMLLTPKDIQTLHKSRLNKNKFWVKMALGNIKVQYQADLKKIMENKNLSYVSDQKLIDPVLVNITDSNGEQFKQSVFQVTENKKESYQSFHLQRSIVNSLSPQRRFSETMNQKQYQNVIKGSNTDLNSKHFQSVRDNNKFQQSENQQQQYKNTTSRQDVQDLENWLEVMLQQIYSENNLKADQVLENVQLIYTACLKELIRQVSLQCTERGLLIQKVWDAYLTLFEKLIELNATEKRNLEKLYIEDVNRISKGYEANINQLSKSLSQMQISIDELTSNLDMAIQNNHVLKEVNDKFQSEIKIKDAEIESLKQNIKLLSWDNDFYQTEYVNQQKNQENRQKMEEKAYIRLKQLEDQKYQSIQNYQKQSNSIQLSTPNVQKTPKQNNFIDFKAANYQTQQLKIEKRCKSANNSILHLEELNIEMESLYEFSKLRFPIKTFTEEETQTENIEINQEKHQTNSQQERIEKDQSDIINQAIQERENQLRQQIEQELKEQIESNLRSQIKQQLREQIENELQQKYSQQQQQKEKQNSQQSQRLQRDSKQQSNQKQKQPNQNQQLKQLIEQLNLEKQQMQLEKQQLQQEIQNIKKDQEQKIQQQEEEIEQMEQLLAEKDQLITQKEKIIKEKEMGSQIKTKEIQQLQQDQKKQTKEFQNKIDKIEEQLKKYIEKEKIQLTSSTTSQFGNVEINQTDWRSIYQAIRDNSDLPDIIKQNIDIMLNLITKEQEEQKAKNQETSPQNQNEITEQQPIENEQSLIKQSSKSFQNQNENQFQNINPDPQQDQEEKIQQMKELEDAKLEIEEIKDNVSDLTNKNKKLINKVKQLKDIIRSQKNTIIKIQDIAKQLVQENRKIQQQTNEYSIQDMGQNTQESFNDIPFPKEEIKSDEPENISIIEFVPIEQQSSPTSKTKSMAKNFKMSQPQSKKSISKPGENSPTQIFKNKQARRSRFDALINQLGDLTNDFIINDEDGKEDVDFDDYLPQIHNVRRSSMRLFTNKKTKTYEFKLGQVQKKDRTISANAEPALKLLSKVQDRIKENKHQISQTKNNIIKFVLNVYQDRIKNPQNVQNPLYVIAYDNMMQKYGLKKVAETKLQQFLESTMKYLDNSRIKMFSRFARIYDPYDSQDFELYIKCLKFVEESGNSGMQIINQPFDRMFISHELSLQALTNQFQDIISQDKVIELVDWINKNKIQDKNKSDLIDFDDMMEQILEKYNQTKNNVLGNVEDLFFAADLNKNGQIEIDEFITLYRHLEKERFDLKKAQDLFLSEADIISSDGERNLSLNKFASISLQEGLFKIDKQTAFSNQISHNDFVRNIDQLRVCWKDICSKIKKRLMRCNSYTDSFKEIIENLDSQLKQKLDKDQFLWISYRLLDEESKRFVLEYEVDLLVPVKFNQIQDAFYELEDSMISK
ncbi:EF hand protein (macronuclear) [Tetrahymena thermophila SB210]|uniref:EF hand protein n=1 Tax=Tetrahymena thermophila (strain SB210) TaxID=312017 RepID=Q24FP6_TETTS|nr:EF hand protein [Tetrahymena thermophila SB210]EAS06598.2 EF hand protein [Tetrahymena thermophila SB210]|eukprot:XP_001026843.2 EF hand protein [Tetrahymena thermophila SB210]